MSQMLTLEVSGRHAAQFGARARKVFEGRGGYFVAVTRQPFELAPFGGKGNPSFRIMDCLIKRYPLGQYSQSVVHAALEARTKVKNINDIAFYNTYIFSNN